MIRRLHPDSIVESIARRALVNEPEVVPSSGSAQAWPVVSAETESIDTVAFRKGYAEGFEAGEQDAAAEYTRRESDLQKRAADALQAQEAAWEAKHARLDNLLGQLADSVKLHANAMHELAFELAALTLQEVFTTSDADRSLMLRVCERLAQERRGQGAHLEVSVVDRAWLPERIDGLVVSESITLSAGECRLVGEYGVSETSIAMRLDAVFAAMRTALAGPQS
ncbi:hypothetical protein [Dyella sp.]|uniref:FliH/SctL family protein n=1 Tax=Dyella sp. TaxID=1869338 RepID=UPI002ED18330